MDLLTLKHVGWAPYAWQRTPLAPEIQKFANNICASRLTFQLHRLGVLPGFNSRKILSTLAAVQIPQSIGAHQNTQRFVALQFGNQKFGESML